jgi:uncharacterized membrane protein
MVVGQSSSTNGFEAFTWTAGGGMVGLGSLPGNDFGSDALAVSADGSVVVGSSFVNDAPISEAFYWTESLGMVNLRDLLIANGATNLAGWTLHEAIAVSADGLTIVGSGHNPNGRNEGWIATIPEPSALFLSLSAVACLTTLSARVRRDMARLAR